MHMPLGKERDMKYALVVGQQPTRPPPSLATTINSTKGGLMEARRSIRGAVIGGEFLQGDG
jgi:hypothetical protein